MGTKLIGMSEDSQRSAGLSEDELVLLNDPCVPEAVKKDFVDLEARDHRERLRTMRMLLLRNRIELPPEIMDEAVAKADEMLKGNDAKSRREAIRFLKDVAAHNLNVDKALMDVVTRERDAEPPGRGMTIDDYLDVVQRCRDEAQREARERYGTAADDPPEPPEAEPAGDGA